MDEWGDELSELAGDGRRAALRRGAYLTVCATLVVLIVLTVVFVGDDTTTVAQVSADRATTSLTTSTTGFTTSLPVGVTATSTAETSSTTTLPGETTTTTRPRSSNTTVPFVTTTTLPPQPKFQYSPPGPKLASGSFPFPGGECPFPLTSDFFFNTPSPGTLTIQDNNFGITATGSVKPDGKFDVFGPGPNSDTERIKGTTTQTGATGTITWEDPNKTCVYTGSWTFN